MGMSNNKQFTSLTADEVALLVAKQARLSGACSKVDSVQGIESLASLLFTPQGAEFCIKHRFPAMPTWWMLADKGAENHGVFINRGDLTLLSQEGGRPMQVALIGRTFANADCRGNVLHTIVVLRGASLVVDAYDWSVVRIWADPTAHVIKKPHGNAVII